MREKKSLWQFVKFIIVSSIVGIIQLALANILPLLFDSMTVPIPNALRGIFVPEMIFDMSTESGAYQSEKYILNGAITWGYVLPFFLSNALANIYGYFQNRRTTFKSGAPKRNFVYYFIILIALILFSTWLQGVITGALASSAVRVFRTFARTVASAAAGTLQLIILFPLEKYVLLKEKKA